MKYDNIQGMPESSILKEIEDLYREIFRSEADISREIETKTGLSTFVAKEDEKIVGFKLGYERKEKHFYSWLGGVDKTYRGRGIASELMKRQHDWCRRNGYWTIRTHTKNKWKDMLILNLKHGFDVIGTYTDEKGEPKIILEKKLYFE